MNRERITPSDVLVRGNSLSKIPHEFGGGTHWVVDLIIKTIPKADMRMDLQNWDMALDAVSVSDLTQVEYFALLDNLYISIKPYIDPANDVTVPTEVELAIGYVADLWSHNPLEQPTWNWLEMQFGNQSALAPQSIV